VKAMDELHSHLRTRLVGLREAKDAGTKIIGYTPGGYFPEEVALACGAIPVGLIRGGEHAPVMHSGAYICRWIDTFCRAQIGYGVSGEDPYYGIIDLLVVPITDNHIRAVSDVLDFNTDIDIFPYGVPHKKEGASFDYFLHGINRVKGKLEELTGREITKANLTGKSQSIEGRNAIEVMFEVKGEPGVMFVDSYFGVPLEVTFKGKKYEFRDIVINEVKSQDLEHQFGE